MIQVAGSQDVWLPSPSQLFAEQGPGTNPPFATAPFVQQSVASLVPANAVKFYLVSSLLRVKADANGNIDASVHIQLSGYAGQQNFATVTRAITGCAPGMWDEHGGEIIPVPNIDQTFWWAMDGNTATPGNVCWTCSVMGYALPVVNQGGTLTAHTHPIAIAGTSVSTGGPVTA